MSTTRSSMTAIFAFVAFLVTGCNYHIPSDAAAEGNTRLEGTSPSGPSATAPSMPALQYLTTNLFKSRCSTCHNAARAAAGIDLSSHAAILSARARSGAQVLVPGSTETSLMVKVIEDGTMPPAGARIDPQVVAILKCWITKGAPSDGANECLPVSPQAPSTPGGDNSGGTPGIPGTPGDQPGTPPPPVIPPSKPLAFGPVYTNVLEPYCVGCHAGRDSADGVDLSSYESIMARSKFYGSLLNVDQQRASTMTLAMKRPLVAPGDPDASKLWRVVKENEMPQDGDPLPDELKTMLRRWILEGAKP